MSKSNRVVRSNHRIARPLDRGHAVALCNIYRALRIAGKIGPTQSAEQKIRHELAQRARDGLIERVPGTGRNVLYREKVTAKNRSLINGKIERRRSA